MFVYDPVFNAEDMLLFKELQIQPLTENKAGCSQYSTEEIMLMTIVIERRIFINTSNYMFHASL